MTASLRVRATASWARREAEAMSVRVSAAPAPSAGAAKAASRHAAVAGRDEAPVAVRTQPRLVPRALCPRCPRPISGICSTPGVSGQARFANNTASPLSYAVLDGFEVPLPLVRVIDRPRPAIRSIRAVHRRLFQARRRNRSERLGSGLSPKWSASTRRRSGAIHR